MSNCENCNNASGQVWKYRRPTDTMTYWREEWRCARCHPRMREQASQSRA